MLPQKDQNRLNDLDVTLPAEKPATDSAEISPLKPNGFEAAAASESTPPATTTPDVPTSVAPAGNSETATSAVPAAADAAGSEAPDLQATSEYQKRFLKSVSELTGARIDDQGGTGFFRKSGITQQSVVARLVNLTGRLGEFQGTEGTYRQAYFASQLLRNSKAPASETVMSILDDIEFRSSRNSPIYSVMQGLTRFILVFFMFAAVFCISYVWFSARAAGVPWDQVVFGPLIQIFESPFIVAGAFGILGSMVSLLLRLSEFEGATRRSRQFLTMTGAMLPLVGGVFACVTCALFASGLINFNFASLGSARSTMGTAGTGPFNPLDPAVTFNIYFYVVIGFLSGFSERFTRGLLGSAENTVSSTLTKQVVEGADGTTGSLAIAKQSTTRKGSV